MTSLLKSVGWLLHSLLKKSTVATEVYFNLLSLCLRTLSIPIFKQQVVNSINSVRWSEKISLSPRLVQVGTTRFKIIPHLHEFDFEAVVSLHLGYERELFALLETRLLEYDAIVEIGANVGVFSLFAACFTSAQSKQPKIFVFEPSREAYFRLLQNLQINQITTVQSFNCAISDTTAFLDFFEPQGHLTNGTLNQSFAQHFSESIKVTKTLVLHGHFIEKLLLEDKRILIKVDAEGAECAILRSLKSLIQQKQVDLIVEVLPDYQAELNRLEFLFAHSYSLFNITDQGLIKHDQFVASHFRDYLLLPCV